jgi:hypothetical protein
LTVGRVLSAARRANVWSTLTNPMVALDDKSNT